MYELLGVRGELLAQVHSKYVFDKGFGHVNFNENAVSEDIAYAIPCSKCVSFEKRVLEYHF